MQHVCPICGRTFSGPEGRRFCSHACRNKEPGRMSDAGRERLRQSKLGDKSPMRQPGVAAKSGAARRGKYAGPNHPRYKGVTFVDKGAGGKRAVVWIDAETQRRYGLRRPHMYRARLVWAEANPGETLKRTDIIHHKNLNSLDDRPENLERLTSQREHARLHKFLAGVNAERVTRKERAETPCETCGKLKAGHRRFCSVACTGKAFSGEGNPNAKRKREEG